MIMKMKLKVLKPASKVKKNDAFDEKKINETYKAIQQLNKGAFEAIDKAYMLLKALKNNLPEDKFDYIHDIREKMEDLGKARVYIKELVSNA